MFDPPVIAFNPRIRYLIREGALFVANHSGGKDSQAMLTQLRRHVPARQLVVAHATLGEIEWDGAEDVARHQAERDHLPFIVAAAGKSLFGMVERKFETRPDVPSWPSSANRQCTSDLKRDPIAREVRRYADSHGFNKIVTCLGLRAEESPARAKKTTFKIDKRGTNSRRDWWEWLPIHHWTTDEVFAAIAEDGLEPHWAYAEGNSRLSCVFCIFGSQGDLENGARQRPGLALRYIELERRTGYTMHMSRRSLLDLVGHVLEETEEEWRNSL